MSIQHDVTVTIAEVDVTDDYRVSLVTIERETDYTPDEAMQLASELSEAAGRATAALRSDAGWAAELKADRAARAIEHGFDR